MIVSPFSNIIGPDGRWMNIKTGRDREKLWFYEQEKGGIWPTEHCHRAIQEGIAPSGSKVVSALSCGCCGELQLRDSLDIKVVGKHFDQTPILRCRRHIGRNPCLIEGCGKTFKIADHESYRTSIICGTHWRQAPKILRTLISRLQRKGTKLGWNARLISRYERLWNRAARLIVEGRAFDIKEIEDMF